jgi:20S proteasome subunit beta 2
MSELSIASSSLVDSGVPAGGGFSFENYARNSRLALVANQQKSGADGAGSYCHQLALDGKSALTTFTVPKPKKTGTTIVGCVFDGGVVLGADTRSTNDTEVAEKNCTKIHYMAPNIYCCGAGTAADTEKTTELIASQLELLRMETHSESRVATAMVHLKRMLYRYQGYISAALVLGGVDVSGPHIYQIHPHGSTSKLSYTTMGSGSLAAMAVFESSFRDSMSEQEAVTLVQRSIMAGIFNDLGSGSNCDICVIRADRSVDYRRGAVAPNDIAPLRAAVQRSGRLTMRPGLTPVLHTTFVPHPKSAAKTDDDDAEDRMEVES